MDDFLINEIAVCIVTAWILALGAQLLKQPPLVAYLVAGYVIGPMGLKWIHGESISVISELGLILLLFMIGLEIDLKKILGAGKVIILTALSQIAGGCALGLAFFWALRPWLGGASLDTIYLAVVAALSSTVITVKILFDKRELDTLAGRITLGVLVMQDLFAILFLAIQPSLRQPSLSILALSLGRVAVLMAFAFIISRYALPLLFRTVARLPELVLVGALAWCFMVAAFASLLDLSREMGALVAGVAISTFPYALDVTAKVTSIRDFFVTLFFVALGMMIPRPDLAVIGWALAVCLFLAGSRFLTVFPLLHWMKQGHRVGSLVGINLSQLSEFSLVILLLGKSSRHVTDQTYGMVAYAFAFLAVGSTYAITFSDELSRWFTRRLARANFRDLGDQPQETNGDDPARDIYLLGFFWTASSLLEELERRSPALLQRLVVVDFNPQVYNRLKARGVRVIYGDISQRDTLLHAGIGHAKVILCTLPNMILKGSDNLRMLQQLRELNPAAQIMVHAEMLTEVPKLYAAGAAYVTVPRLLEAVELCGVVQAAAEGHLAGKRRELDAELANRHEIIP